MMEAVRTSETSVDNHFTRQYNPEDSCEHHTRRRENLKSHKICEHGDRLKVKINVFFCMETTFEPLHLDKEILAQEKIMYIIYNCI
jgi:hypothetical protein